MMIPSPYGPMPLEPGASRDARSDAGRETTVSAMDRKPAWRIFFTRRRVGWLALLLPLVLASGCYNRQSNPPPNPLISTSSSEAAPASAAPSAPMASSTPAGPPRPMYYDFPDIPVPVELKRIDKDSFVFQSGALKAGLLSLRGTRIDLSSLINFFQIALPRESWKPKGGFHAGRTVLIFEKPDKTCVINLYEQLFSTYVEIYVAPATDQPISGLPLPLTEPRFAELPPTPTPLPEGQIKTS